QPGAVQPLRYLRCLVSSSANSVLILSFFFTSLFHYFFPSSAVPKKNHIPFLHYVLFSLQPHLSLLPRRRQASRGQQIIPPHNFRAYETLLDVAINPSRRLHCRRSLPNPPRAPFRLPRREK